MTKEEKEQLILLIKATVRNMNITGGSGATAFTGLSDVPSSYSGQTLKVVRVNAGETALEFTTLAGGGDMLAANNLSDVANAATSRTNLGINTTANQIDSTDKRFMTDAQEAIVDGVTAALSGKAPSLGPDDNYVTDAEKVVIGNTSGTNSGDNATNTQYSGLAASKLNVPTGTPDGTKYLRDDNTWQAIAGGSGLSQSQVLARASIGF